MKKVKLEEGPKMSILFQSSKPNQTSKYSFIFLLIKPKKWIFPLSIYIANSKMDFLLKCATANFGHGFRHFPIFKLSHLPPPPFPFIYSFPLGQSPFGSSFG
jgi:hypothetical protein